MTGTFIFRCQRPHQRFNFGFNEKKYNVEQWNSAA